MFDPITVAFNIKYPWRSIKPCKTWPKGCRDNFITIYHNDPCKDNTDDSCGRRYRGRVHGGETLEEVVSLFTFAWDGACGWFASNGDPLYSSQSIVLQMFRLAAAQHYDKDYDKAEKFMHKFLYKILIFAENPIDSLHQSIQNAGHHSAREARIRSMASCVYGCVLDWTKPWYKDPRLHVHHWSIQIHPLRKFWAWIFDKCGTCGGNFKYGEPRIRFESGNAVFHENCHGSVGCVENKEKAPSVDGAL